MPPLNPDHFSPTGQRVMPVIDTTYRQPLALLLLGAALIEQGFSAEQASGMVRRTRAVIESQEHATSERMAERMERHAADVAAAREAERMRLEAVHA